jgi:signal transduction histidine kinase
MAAGASATFNVLKRAYFAFSIPALLPQVVLFMISGNTIFIAMGGMLVVFWILITVSAMTNHEATLTSLRLRFERDDLIASLESAQDQTERKNDALQKEIAQREKAESELREAHALLEKKVALRTGELKSANTRLEELNHELSDFTHSVSHDLRTPLTSIEGFTDILEEESGTTLNEPAREALYYIRKSIGRMKDLIQDLLVLARASQMELVMESVDLSSMALEIAGNLRTQQPQRKVEFVIQPGILAVGDARLIRIVLENLIGNAWKYTGKTEQPHIEFSLVKKDQEVIYCLADNGAGFDMKYADKLFAPFQRLHSESAFPGTGIGLATVDKIISRHGGRIWAQSSPGNGARFYFTLGHL